MTPGFTQKKQKKTKNTNEREQALLYLFNKRFEFTRDTFLKNNFLKEVFEFNNIKGRSVVFQFI